MYSAQPLSSGMRCALRTFANVSCLKLTLPIESPTGGGAVVPNVGVVPSDRPPQVVRIDGNSVPSSSSNTQADRMSTEPMSASSSPAVESISAPQSEAPSRREIKLSKEQEQVFNLVKARKSVFFTGSAGTGKSVLLREIINWCKSSYLNLAVTASTGIAAVNIGGCTLHSWAGIGLGKEPVEQLLGRLFGHDRWRRQKLNEERQKQGLPRLSEEDDDDKTDSFVLKRWRKCRVLIIDESESIYFCCSAGV